MTPETLQELKISLRRLRWAFEELVVDQKMQEANFLLSNEPKPMIEYLARQFGSVESVLAQVRDLVRVQKARRKTLVK